MSTCRGCWGDDLAHVPGVVLTTVVGADPMVWHTSVSARCSIAEPHPMAECLEFDSPRPGCEPAPELPRGPFLRQMHSGDWDRYFALLDGDAANRDLMDAALTGAR
jgi:hypothetical protein